MATNTAPVVYECSGCGERSFGPRCSECNLFSRKLGPGGCCPSCGELVALDELEEG